MSVGFLEAAGRTGPRTLLAVLGLGVSLAACASTSPQMAARGAKPPSPARAAQAAPAPTHQRAAATAAPRVSTTGDGERALGGRYKLGAPYEAGGLWYVPAEQPDYDEVGIASWYGDEFDGQPTANGERFDMYVASAAHATLPMPSIVEVTNLENGRSIRVRLNDRGPFKNGRIIDLSRGAARELGYLEQGTTKVRVRYVGPARLDGSNQPLFVAQGAGASGAIVAAPLAPPPAAPIRVAGGGDGFVVQAGAFSDPVRAGKVAEMLSHAGAAAVRPVEVESRRLYRVVVGPWRDEDRAAAARAEVAALGFADARVIRAY